MAIRYQYPFRKPYRVGTPFGQKGTLWKSGYHSGLDLISLAAGGDGKVYPVAPGSVIRSVAGDGSYGNYVTVRHEDGMLSLYAHLKSIAVTLGQVVGYDTQLGVEGATGNVTGPHLHLELHEKEYHYPAVIDPAAFLDARLGEQQAPAVVQHRDPGLHGPGIVGPNGEEPVRQRQQRRQHPVHVLVGHDAQDELHAPLPQPESAPAQDNQPDAYAAQAVAWAVAEGLLRGDDTGNLRLHEPVTRQDVVVLLHRMKDLA